MSEQDDCSVLITGGDGLLARSLRKHASRKESWKEGEVLAKNHQQLDITRSRHVRRTLRKLSPDLLLNTAGYTDVDGCESNPDRARRVNGEAPGHLADLCEELDITFVHYSTDYVFDGTSDRPYREEDEPDPINTYGQTKLEGEQRVLNKLPGALVLRSSWLFGEGGPNFVQMIQQRLSNDETIPVVTDQTGSPTSTTVLADATFHLLTEGETGLFHVTCRGETTWFGFATAIQNRLSTEGALTPITGDQLDRAARRPSYSVLDTGKLEATGFSPPHWEDALDEYIEQ